MSKNVKDGNTKKTKTVLKMMKMQKNPKKHKIHHNIILRETTVVD